MPFPPVAVVDGLNVGAAVTEAVVVSELSWTVEDVVAGALVEEDGATTSLVVDEVSGNAGTELDDSVAASPETGLVERPHFSPAVVRVPP